MSPAPTVKLGGWTRFPPGVFDIASAVPDADPDVKEALGFFDTKSSGKWEVREVIEAAEQVPDDLGSGDQVT